MFTKEVRSFTFSIFLVLCFEIRQIVAFPSDQAFQEAATFICENSDERLAKKSDLPLKSLQLSIALATRILINMGEITKEELSNQEDVYAKKLLSEVDLICPGLLNGEEW